MARPNIVVLRDLQKNLPSAQRLFAMLADAQEIGECLTVDELIENLDLGRRSAIDLLRGLEDAGAGEFRLGRKGHPSRLVWSTDPQPLVDELLDREVPPSPPPPPSPGFVSASTIDHVFVLRPDLRIGLSLPADLSAGEAAALGEWVRHLSFER